MNYFRVIVQRERRVMSDDGLSFDRRRTLPDVVIPEAAISKLRRRVTVQ
jgi:hypothetical protein